MHTRYTRTTRKKNRNGHKELTAITYRTTSRILTAIKQQPISSQIAQQYTITFTTKAARNAHAKMTFTRF